jgi:hypothetical protein
LVLYDQQRAAEQRQPVIAHINVSAFPLRMQLDSEKQNQEYRSIVDIDK